MQEFETPSPDAVPDEPSSEPPEAPEGFHPAVMGSLKVKATSENWDDVAMYSPSRERWEVHYSGDSKRLYYALRIGSEIAMLNGLEVETIPDEPEPRKAREWEASVGKAHGGEWLAMPTVYDEKIRVREILPGEPTPEQVQALVRMLTKSLEEHQKVNGYLAARIKEGEFVNVWKRETESLLDAIKHTLAPFLPEKK
jgi:hypothetical protein